MCGWLSFSLLHLLFLILFIIADVGHWVSLFWKTSILLLPFGPENKESFWVCLGVMVDGPGSSFPLSRGGCSHFYGRTKRIAHMFEGSYCFFFFSSFAVSLYHSTRYHLTILLVMCFKLINSIHALLSNSLKIQRASKKIGFEMSLPLYRRGGLSTVDKSFYSILLFTYHSNKLR